MLHRWQPAGARGREIHRREIHRGKARLSSSHHRDPGPPADGSRQVVRRRLIGWPTRGELKRRRDWIPGSAQRDPVRCRMAPPTRRPTRPGAAWGGLKMRRSRPWTGLLAEGPHQVGLDLRETACRGLGRRARRSAGPGVLHRSAFRWPRPARQAWPCSRACSSQAVRRTSDRHWPGPDCASVATQLLRVLPPRLHVVWSGRGISGPWRPSDFHLPYSVDLLALVGLGWDGREDLRGRGMSRQPATSAAR
jgi:hypothetical protein